MYSKYYKNWSNHFIMEILMMKWFWEAHWFYIALSFCTFYLWTELPLALANPHNVHNATSVYVAEDFGVYLLMLSCKIGLYIPHSPLLLLIEVVFLCISFSLLLKVKNMTDLPRSYISERAFCQAPSTSAEMFKKTKKYQCRVLLAFTVKVKNK